MSYPFVNLCDLLSESVKQFPEKMALAAKKEGVYVPLTYRVLSDRVRGFDLQKEKKPFVIWCKNTPVKNGVDPYAKLTD